MEGGQGRKRVGEGEKAAISISILLKLFPLRELYNIGQF